MKKIIFYSFLIVVYFTVNSFSVAQSNVSRFNAPHFKIHTSIDAETFTLDPGRVGWLRGIFATAMHKDMAYRVIMNSHPFLLDFRVHAELPPKTKRYGGGGSSELAAHLVGHHLPVFSSKYGCSEVRVCLGLVPYLVQQQEERQSAGDSAVLVYEISNTNGDIKDLLQTNA